MTPEAVDITHGPKAGFTLIETLIAVAIAGIAFFVLTETFFNVLLTLEKLKGESDFQQEVRFVRTEIIRIADRNEVEQGGTIATLDFGDARWRARIHDTNVVDLFRLHLEIEFQDADGERISHEETLHLLRPTWSDPLERSALLDDIRRDIQNRATFRDW